MKMADNNLMQLQFSQKAMHTRNYSNNASNKIPSTNQSDDFSKVLNDRKEEKEIRKKSTEQTEDKEDISKDKSSKVDENNSKKTSKADENKNEKTSKVDESSDSEISRLDKDEEISMADESINEEKTKIDDNGKGDTKEEIPSELKSMLEDLINTLQLNGMIDQDDLQGIINDFEKDDLNLDELKTLIDELKLIGGDTFNDTINDKLSEISQLVEALASNEGSKQFEDSSNTTINISNDENLNDEEVNLELKANTEKSEEKQEEKNSNSEAKGFAQSSVEEKDQLFIKRNANNDILQPKDTDFVNIKNVQVENLKGYEIEGVNKTLQNVSKPDMNIFNQVIESAKININEDVSEMLIKMKPDNLGKLSMKIVVDRGMLVARFDVESQIVKEAIESNLEDLRNALKDKGFEIQQFDVSVNKESNQNQNQFSYLNQRKSKKAAIGTDFATKDPYYTNQSSIEGLTSTINYLG